MAFVKKLSLVVIGAGLFLAGYSCDRSQQVVIKKDWLGTTQSVSLKQAGIERTLFQDPKDFNKWIMPRNKSLDSACDLVVGAGKWIYEKASSVYEANKKGIQSTNVSKEYDTQLLSDHSH